MCHQCSNYTSRCLTSMSILYELMKNKFRTTIIAKSWPMKIVMTYKFCLIAIVTSCLYFFTCFENEHCINTLLKFSLKIQVWNILQCFWLPNDNLTQKCTLVSFWIGEIMKPSCLECRTAHRQTSSQGHGWDISSYSNCYYYIWTQIYKHSHFSCTFDFLEPFPSTLLWHWNTVVQAIRLSISLCRTCSRVSRKSTNEQFIKEKRVKLNGMLII